VIAASSHVAVNISPRGFFLPEWHNSHHRTAKNYPEGMTAIVQLPRRRPQKFVRVGLLLPSQQLFINFIQSFVLTFGLSASATPCTVLSNQQIEQRIADVWRKHRIGTSLLEQSYCQPWMEETKKDRKRKTLQGASPRIRAFSLRCLQEMAIVKICNL